MQNKTIEEETPTEEEINLEHRPTPEMEHLQYLMEHPELSEENY
jgi:hypothetical protein